MTSEYTPTDEVVKRSYADAISVNPHENQDDQYGCDLCEEAHAHIDRFIARVKAEALREAQANVRASSFWADGSDNYADRVRGFLEREADRIEKEAGL